MTFPDAMIRYAQNPSVVIPSIRSAQKYARDSPHVRYTAVAVRNDSNVSDVAVAAPTNETFTVRRIVNNEGVERIFPLHSPFISKVVVRRSGESRRAKLFYLRNRVGKAVRLTEKRKAKKDEGQAEQNSQQQPELAASAS